ncbi:toll/interleukin-1 receptor domain-containing protein [Piscinibacter sp.]|uniref:toll/interleukin-1 receptor domain-containing protein n=1 Tax=Piscinibacter sp. TaxID=1903157 RepID=UPI002D05F9DB|nr:toll/interleukin-1 receptor domain-containing protein [Albitalea sp.]HUG22363.1 toll/interleukin-1 receptor domain-containing protein [Albitalea sp.]
MPIPAGSIFISYRRDDTAGYARAIADTLGQHFSDERVFIDVDDIEAGRAFDEVIERAVGSSAVLLVLIGKRWSGEQPGQPPRIADPQDFVHREIAAALAKDLRVVPLLLDGARMPAADELPDALRPLAKRHALEIGGSRFRDDMARLAGVIRETVGDADRTAASTASAGKRRVWLTLAGATVLAVAAGSALLLMRPGRADVNGTWEAQVTYDWPNAIHAERFVFAGIGEELHGTASFLRADRGILEGTVDADGLRFVTRTMQVMGSDEKEQAHRYRGRLDGDQIRFVMQSEGGHTSHVPIEFVARRTAAP